MTLQATTMSVSTLSFRNSIVAPRARLWLRDGTPVAIGGRAFDLLILLLAARGDVLSTRDILEGVWPGMHVGQENIRVQVASLRRAMGRDADLIKSVNGRGYMFAEEPPQSLG